MKSLTPEHFEEFGKNRLKKIIESGEETTIIAGFIDYFGDGKLALCSICFTPAWVRPWLFEAINQYNMKVVCICCADPQVVKGQVVMDWAKLDADYGSKTH